MQCSPEHKLGLSGVDGARDSSTAVQGGGSVLHEATPCRNGWGWFWPPGKWASRRGSGRRGGTRNESVSSPDYPFETSTVWKAPKLDASVRIRPPQALRSAMLKYGAGARCVRNTSVAAGQICALFPEMKVALESSLNSPGSSFPNAAEGGLEGVLQKPSHSNGIDHVRLRLLRQHDRNRTWNSARERRVCMLCGSEFEGVQIRVSVRAGKPVFSCPEPGCRGSLPHFATSGNPLLDEAAWLDWMRPTCNPASTVMDEE